MRRTVTATLALATLAASLAAPASALAADDSTLVLTSTTGDPLAGRTFTAYRIGDYANVTVKDGKVAGYELKGDAARNAWVQAALKDAGLNAAAPAGQDEVAAVTTLTGADLRKAANALAASDKRPDAEDTVSGTTTNSRAEFDLPEGLYLITDTTGVPMIASTTIDGLTKFSDGSTLGRLTVKTTTVTLSKKVFVDGAWKDSASLTAGNEAQYRLSVNMPNGGSGTVSSVKVVDVPVGQHRTGDITVKADGTDVTALTDVYEAGQTIPANPSIPNDTARTVPDGGFGLGLDKVAEAHPGAQVEILVNTVIDAADDGHHPQTGVAYTSIWDGTASVTPPTDANPGPDGSCPTGVNVSCAQVPVNTYGFDLNKTSMGDETAKVSGAGFRIQDKATGEWLSLRADGSWGRETSETAATELFTGDANRDGTVSDAEKTADTAGRITFAGLGAGEYLVKETTVPEGFSSASKPSFTATITDDGKVSFKGDDLPNLTEDAGGSVTVRNMTTLAQLPATGGVWTVGSFLAGAALIAMLAAGGAHVARTRRIEASAPIAV